ncbi:response regulator transcription factor [Nesterenkonia sp. PF2B19]|uniref:response regulator transcription factor n=1 Tax=unclassified Nesterenkonia TaxID=2629769 RepID=UPI000872F927|nr:response regulator transcription factor [Nesterenkonia sp. PF2B19]OSM42771.1 hypothetical protein BCY76_012540 [Nesterenkonia sp. PF2B19]
MIQVLVVDDHPAMRDALSIYVRSASDMELVGGHATGQAALHRVRDDAPDVVLLDLHLPDHDGVEITRIIVDTYPRTRVLALSALTSPTTVAHAILAGATGYLSKGATAREIVAGIRRVHADRPILDSAIAPHLLVSPTASPDALHRAATRILSLVPEVPPRELETLQHLSTGLSNHEIAQAMTISEAAVKGHLSRLNRRLDARDRVQLLIRATQLGLVRPRM